MSDADDWLALWSEHSFSDPDAAGHRGATRPQLRLAVDLADEPLDIDKAVREGHLRKQTETDIYGVERPPRYRLNLAGGVTA